jgi:large subunit ribosomal protein L21
LEEIMYAIVRTGGKQYQVAQGDQLRVEKVAGNVGDTVELDQVLLVGEGEQLKIGRPVVEGAKVTATIMAQGKAKKVMIFKKKRRKGFQVKKGHRQMYTALRIVEISA